MTLVTLSSVIKRPLTEHVFRLVRSGTLLSRLARVRNFSNSVALIAFCFTLFEADSDNFLVYICTRRSAHDHFLTLISVRSALITWTTIRSSSYIKLTCRAHFFKLLDISSKQTREPKIAVFSIKEAVPFLQPKAKPTCFILKVEGVCKSTVVLESTLR